jgi:hypothetical protein
LFVGVGECRCQPTPGGLLLDESFLLDLTSGGSVVREVSLHRDRGYGGVLAVGHVRCEAAQTPLCSRSVPGRVPGLGG